MRAEVVNDPDGTLSDCVEELIVSLKAAPAITSFLDVQRRFQEDAELTRLRRELQAAADAFQRMPPAGAAAKSALADLRARQAGVQAHPLVQQYVTAKNLADTLLKQVNAIISAQVGVDVAGAAAPAGGCC